MDIIFITVFFKGFSYLLLQESIETTALQLDVGIQPSCRGGVPFPSLYQPHTIKKN